MKRSLKTLLLLLSAGVYAATSWADSLIARWDDFDGLTAETPLAPTDSATVNELNGGSWKFNLGGGTVTDGVLATGTGSAPNIEFDEAFEVGRTSKPITVLVAVKLPYTPVANKPILHIGNGTVGYGLTATNNKNTFEASWQNQRWSNTPSKTIEGMEAESGVVYLVYSVADTSTNASVTSVTLDTATYTWQTFSGLTGTGVSSSKIVFGNFVNATSDGLNYNLKSVAVFNGAFAPLADVQSVIRGWEGVVENDVTATLSGTSTWGNVAWDNAPNNFSNVTLTVDAASTLTMSGETSILTLTANGSAPLTIDGAKLTANSANINTDVTVNEGAADLGVATIANTKTLTVKNGYFANGNNISNGSKLAGVGTIALDLGANALTLCGAGSETFSGAVDLIFGTLTMTGGGNSGFLTGRTVNILNGATAIIGDDNATGHTANNPSNSIVHVQQGGTLNFTSRNSFKSTLKLSGGIVNLNGGESYKFNNYTRVLDWMSAGAYLQAEALDGASIETPTISTINAVEGMSIALRSALGIVVAEKAKLVINAPISNDSSRLVTKSGAGVLAVTKPIFAPLTISAGELIVSSDATLGNGEVAVNGGATLTVAKSMAPTNTITNDGTITADTATVDLTGATINGSGTYGVTNNGTLILSLAQTDGKSITVADGATLKVSLAANEQLEDQSVTVTGSGSVVFVDANNHETVLGEGNTYTPQIAEFTYTVVEDGTGDWDATPAANAKITIAFGATENKSVDLSTILGDVTSVAMLSITGDDGGTIEQGNNTLTIATLDLQTNVTMTGAFLKDCVTAHTTVTVPENKTLSISVPYGGTDWDCALKHSFDGAGTVKKMGAGSLSIEDAYGASFTCAPALVIAEGAFRFASSNSTNYTNLYNITIENGAMLKLGYGSVLTHANSTITMNDGAIIEAKNGNNGTATVAQIFVNGDVTIKGSWAGDSTTFGGKISGNGTLTIDQVEAKRMAFNGVIANGEAGDSLKVIIKQNAAAITFSGANTYTGGTEIEAGATLINADGSALGTGKVTGAGTLIVNIGKHPGNHDRFGFADATSWTGTVEFTGGNFATPVEFSKWQNANSKFKVASGATVFAANGHTFAGTLMGGGTINNTLTFASGATLDATTETLTATGAVTFGETLNVKVSGDIVGTQILKKADANITEEVVVENVAVVVNGNEGYSLAQNAEGYVLREKVENPELSVDVAGGMTSLSAALGENELAANTILNINFGDGTTPGRFTFDNDAEVSFAQIIVTGTNGGRIAKSETADAVSATLATINTAVTVDAGVVTFTATEIPARGALTVADTATVSAVSGAGVLAYNGVLPANMTGLTDAATWTGTLALVSTPTQTDIAFNDLGNASSTVRLQGYTGSLSNKTAATCYTPNLEIKGTNTIDAATAYAIPIFQGDVSGDGTIVFSATENTNYLFSGDFSAFTGTMELTHTSPKIAIGAASNTDWNAWNPIVNNGNGNITIATAATLNGTFRAVSGVETTSSAILSGNGTIDCSLALAANATIDASETLLTVTGDITLPNTLTVKVAETPTAVAPVSILTTTATPNVANTTVTVIVDGETLGGTFELVKNGDNLQVRVAPDRIAASETPVSVTEEVPSAIFLDTATFSGYGQTFTVLQYTGTGTPDWEGMYVEGLPEGAQVIKTDTTWGFTNHTLTVWPIGDSITAGLVKYNEGGSANWHVAGGYRLPLYQFLNQAGYAVNYVGTSLYPASQTNDSCSNSCEDRDIDSKILKDAGLLHHEGHSGTTLDQLYARFKKAEVQTILAGQGTPDVITLHLGTNDFGGGNSVDTVKTEMKQLLYVLNGAAAEGYTSEDTPLYPNAKVLVAKIIPRSDKDVAANLNAFNEWLETYAAACPGKLILVDLGMDTSYTLLRHDGLHPFAEGYKQMARGWFAAIEKTIAPLKATATIAAVDARVANTLTVTTNKAIDTSLTQTWTLDKGVTVTAAVVADDKRTATLTVDGVVANTEYTLTATNLFGADDSVAKTFTTTADIHTPTTDVTETLATESASKLDGVTKAAEWTTFADFATGFTSPIGCMPESGRAWQLDVRGANVPTVTDGVLSLNGAPLTVNFVDGHIGNTSSTYTVVMTVSNLAVNDVLITESMTQYTNNGSVEGTLGGTNAADAIQLKVKDANTLVWGTTDIPVDVDLTDNEPDTIALSGKWVNGNNYSVAVNGGAKTALSVSGASQTIRDSWSIGALSTANEGSSMKLYRLSFYEGVATLPPPPSVIVNVGDYASWNDAAEAGAVSATMTATTVHFTEANQTFTFNNTDAVRLGIVTVTAEDGVTGGTIALGNGAVTLSSLSLQTNVMAPVAFYNSCAGAVTAASTTTVVAMNDNSAATLTATVVGGVLKQVGEGTVTFAPTADWKTSATPAKFEVANGTLVFNKTRTSWNDPPQLIVSGGTLDLNNTYTYAADGSGYLKNVANEALIVMGGVNASTITGGAVTPWTSAGDTASTIIKYNGAEGANAPATFAADIAGVYSDGSHPRLIDVEKGAQTDGYDLEISGTMGVEGQQFAGTTVKKTGAGVLKISGENNFNTLEVTEGTLWSANANALSATTTVKSGATLVGAGTVATAFTLEENATLDVTKGVVTANGTVSLPNALKLVVETLPTAETPTPVTILSTTAFADATGDVNATLTINGNAAPDYILRKTADAVELHYAPWTTVTEVTASGNVKSWSALLAGMEANREVLDASTGVFIIDFGNADGDAEPGSFEFNNTETLTFASVKVMGSNGGTITKTGSGAVSATATTIEEGCTVTVPASTATLNAVEIKQNATLKVADVTTVTTATGVGTLYVAGIDGNVGLKLKGVSANTKVVLDGVRCYIDNGGNGEVECPIEIGENGFTIMNGWATGSIEFSGALTGEGMLTHAPKQNGTANGTSLGYLLKLTNATGFEGGITLDGEHTKVVIGSGTADAGKIVIADSVTIAQDATWTATNGISVTGEGTISGAGTISIPSGKELTYASSAESTFGGTIAGEGGLTVSSGTLALTGANTYNGATTIAQGAKVIANSGASSTWDYVSNTDSVREPDVTVSGELEIQSSGELYRGFAGTGKITTSGNVTIGMTGDSGHVSGLTNFKGELIVATGTTLTLKGWGLPHNIELSSLQANGNVTATHAGNSPSTTQMTVHELAGSGTIAGVNTFTLADGATIDVSTATAVTVNATTISLPDALAVTLPDAAEMPVSLLNTTAFAGNEGEVKGVTLTVNGEQTGDYLLNKTATALTLDVASWTPVTEVTASGEVDSWSELLEQLAANRQTLADNAALTIDFGSEGGEAGTFSFGEGDVTLGSLTVIGSNGGTITKTGSGAVRVSTSAAINTAVAVTGQVMLNGVTIAENGALFITDWRVIGDNTIAGAGLLTVTGATLPTDVTVRVTDAWTGTVKLTDITDDKLNLANMVTANSNLTLNNVKAYIYDCTINTLTLEGDFQMNNGTTNKKRTQCVTVDNLAGAGTFIGHQSSEVYVAVNVKSWEDFTGSIDLSNEKSVGTIFFFGTAPDRFTTSITPGNVGADDSDFTEADYGTLYVTAGKTLATTADTTWHLRKLVVEDGASFQIKGWATIATSCSGAVSVESGATLDLRALNDLSGINATVEAGGRILVKSGATVPDSIVFETGAILGICPASVDDIGSATLTVTAEGTANSVAEKVGYKTDGVTPLTGWADKGAQGDTLSFGYDPIFDGELCRWAYEFDEDENTTTDSTDGPDNTGRDKNPLIFDGSGSTGRILVGEEYVTNGDGTKALHLAAAPHRTVSAYPEAFTATVYGKLTSQPKTILWGFGSTFNSKNTIALVTGASPNEVSLVWVKGSTSTSNTLGSFPENCVTTLATTTVPNGTTENHLFGFSYELTDTDEDGTNDTTEIIFYVDGDKYQPYKVNKVLTLGGGFQAGSLHGGWPREGIAPTASDWLNRMGNNDADKAATIEFLRVYDDVLPDATFTAMANAYPYISKVGRATRTIVAGADTTWHESSGDPLTGEWSQVKVVDGVAQEAVDQDKPDFGTIKTPEVGTQVVLNVDGANTLYLNEFYSTTTDAETGETETIGNSKLYYERLEINPVNQSGDIFKLYAGRKNPAAVEAGETRSSAVITVQGYTKINTDVVMANNVAYLSGPVSVAEGKTLTFDFTDFNVMLVPTLPVEYRLTGFLDEDTRTRVTSTAPAEPVNARSIDLGYKTDVNQYTFKVDRYPVTAFFTADEMAGGNSTEVNFNNLNYVWQGNDLGKQMNWKAEAVDPQGNHIIENTLAKFVSLDAETKQEKIVTVTLATNDVDPITLTLDEAALTKTVDEENLPMLGEQQLIVGNNVIVNYTGTAATLARTLNEASAETTGVIRTAGFTVDAWRANLSVTGGALAGVGTISGKLTFEEGATLDARTATTAARLSAKDADLTNLKAITVNVDAVTAAGTTGLRVLELGDNHTAKSLEGCTVTAVDGKGDTVATWTETGGETKKLVVVRADGLYVVGRPAVKENGTEINDEVLALPLARRAAEIGASTVNFTGVANTIGDTVKVSAAAAAEVFTNIIDMSETPNNEGEVTASLKYDFGVTKLAVVGVTHTTEEVQEGDKTITRVISTTYDIILEVTVSNVVPNTRTVNTADFADGVSLVATVGGAEVSTTAVDNMTGTGSGGTGPVRYLRIRVTKDATAAGVSLTTPIGVKVKK